VGHILVRQLVAVVIIAAVLSVRYAFRQKEQLSIEPVFFMAN
jgi:hypothetical protein